MNNRRGRVLFIVHDVYQDDNVFPLGVGYLSAVLKNSGAEVRVYSQDVFHYSNEELADFLLENEFDLIGVGFKAARFKETIIDLCKTVNACKKDAYLVLGGHGPSPIPEYVLNKTQADVVVIGEGEETILELLAAKLTGKDGLAKVGGIAYRDGAKCLINPRRPALKDINSIPFPEWSLFPMEKYATCLRLPGHKPQDKYLAVIASRGCINRCNFCYRMEKGIRLRSIENFTEEIKILNERYGINFFLISDEMFITSKKRALDFRDALSSGGLKIKFVCDARVDLMDEEMFGALRECGCQSLNLGLESTSQKVLDLMHKNATVEENERAVQLARKMGFAIGLNFLWGNLGDDAKTLRSNVEFIKKYNVYSQIRTIRPVTPFPGSDLYDEAIHRGLLSGPEDFFEKFKNSDLLTVNFTGIPEKEFYELLFAANKELILDHFAHTSQDMEQAQDLVEQFHNLYFKGDFKFRGPRHYAKKDSLVKNEA